MTGLARPSITTIALCVVLCALAGTVLLAAAVQ
jgi:hypothetical protein